MNLKKFDTLNLHIGAYLSALGSVEMKRVPLASKYSSQ